VSERTVKFHVSSLLAKFGVTDRIALTREVSLGRIPASPLDLQTSVPTLFGHPAADRENKMQDQQSEDQTAMEVRRTRNRVFSSMFPRERFAT
jgi:hypothetical protein